MENSSKTEPKNTVKPIEKENKDWRDKFFDMDLLSPIYVFIFILLFTNGVDDIDLHDAVIRFIANHSGYSFTGP